LSDYVVPPGSAYCPSYQSDSPNLPVFRRNPLDFLRPSAKMPGSFDD
jgi:hypothetical protein